MTKLAKVADVVRSRAAEAVSYADTLRAAVDDWMVSGTFDKRKIKVAMTKFGKAVGNVGKLRAPSKLDQGQRMTYDEARSGCSEVGSSVANSLGLLRKRLDYADYGSADDAQAFAEALVPVLNDVESKFEKHASALDGTAAQQDAIASYLRRRGHKALADLL